MSKSFNQGREEIAKLCRYFADNQQQFRAVGIKEAHIRQSLIDPLFEALGWDVRNKAMAAPQYREVIPEDSLEIEGSQKAPDYTFRIQTIPKFFTEAKKCGININADPGPAYQLRRYGWSARVPFSILTDFEELGVYDCSLKPRPVDKAGFGRTQYYRSEEYPDRWRELWDVFSKEAVLGGAFDKLAAAKRRRGTSEVDDEFLKEIEAWRDSLARNIAVRNQFLGPNDLNTVVQRTIDRIIFLRMAEDRGSEPYGQLLKLCDQPDIYKRFINKLCRKADEKYNSGLFHFSNEAGITEEPDLLSTKIQVDDKVFKPILQGLYFENGSPYHFGVLPVEILGTVYERFLGKVIRLTPEHRAKVEEKPEVRKAGGVYYTPAYIVNYIVNNTVVKMSAGKTPAQLAKFREGQPLRVLDMACGSGSFLLGAFQCLLDHCLKWYMGNSPEKLKKEVYKTVKGEWRLTIAEKKRILTTHIFGVDIDPQAVEVSKLSLLLKVMEGETDETVGQSRMLFHERALPNLTNNIKCGNSLISPDIFNKSDVFDLDEISKINPFDWKTEFVDVMNSGGFDCIIGNPPYDVLEKERGSSSWPHLVLLNYIKNNEDYSSGLGGKLNLFRFFIIRSKSLIREGGRFGMIIPLALLGDVSCALTRHSFFNSFNYVEADCFPQKDNRSRRIFIDAKLSTVILTGVKIALNNKMGPVIVRTYPWNSFSDEHKSYSVNLKELAILDPDNIPVPLMDQSSWELCKRIYGIKDVCRLSDLPDFNISRGEINQTIYRKYISSDPKHARLLKGVEIHRFGLNKTIHQGKIEWFNEKLFLRDNLARQIIEKRRIATQRITGVDDRFRIVATIIDPPCYFADSTNSIVARDEASISLEYLLALLNSKLFQWRFRLTSTNNNVGTNELGSLPIYYTRNQNDPNWIIQSEIIKHSVSLIKLNEMLGSNITDDKSMINRQINLKCNDVNRLIYALYSLNEKEIKLVES